MAKHKTKSAGSDTAGRQGGGSVPASPRSLSRDGRPVVFPVGTTGEPATTEAGRSGGEGLFTHSTVRSRVEAEGTPPRPAVSNPGPSTSGESGRKRPRPSTTPPDEPQRLLGDRAMSWVAVREQLQRFARSPEGTSLPVIQGALDDLEALGSLRVRPARGEDDGVLLRHLSEYTRHGLERVGDALILFRDTLVHDSQSDVIQEMSRRMQTMQQEMRRLRARVAELRTTPKGLREASASRRGRGTASKKGPKSRTPSRARPEKATTAAGLPPPPPSEGEWRKVTAKKRRKKRKESGVAIPPPAPSNKAAARQQPGPSATQKKRKRRTVPTSSAVTITAIGGRPYAELLKTARDRVDLADIGLEAFTLKRARNGGYILGISGDGSADKADRLARDLEEVLVGDALVSRPVKLAEVRITGLDESVSHDELVRTLCAKGECDRSTLRVGTVLRAPNGLGAVWVRCPLATALRLERAGRFRIGWSTAVVRLLEERPLQCYKCLHWGHAAAACKGIDRSGRCFRCGGVGHVARTCTAAQPRCPACDAAKLEAGHRMGGPSCHSLKRECEGKKGPPVRKKGGASGQRRGRAHTQRAMRVDMPAPSRGRDAPPPPGQAAKETVGDMGPPSSDVPRVRPRREATPPPAPPSQALYGEGGSSHDPPMDEPMTVGSLIVIDDDDPSQVPRDIQMGECWSETGLRWTPSPPSSPK